MSLSQIRNHLHNSREYHKGKYLEIIPVISNQKLLYKTKNSPNLRQWKIIWLRRKMRIKILKYLNNTVMDVDIYLFDW